MGVISFWWKLTRKGAYCIAQELSVLWVLKSWAAQRSKRRALPPDYEYDDFSLKRFFLLGFSGLLLICNSSEWVKNVFWSHTNMWSSEHWWHSTTKENQGVRDLKVTLRQKGLPQWSMYFRRGYHTHNEQTVASWHFISDSLLNYLERMHWSHSPGNSQNSHKMPAFI